MTTVILSGPALSITKSDAKYMALMDTDTRAVLCTAVFAPNISKTIQFSLGVNLTKTPDLIAVFTFIKAMGKQYQKTPIVLTDSDALVFSMAVSGAMTSTNTELLNSLASLTFVLQASVEAGEDNVQVRSIRFEGMNISGVKQLSKATDLALTINVS